MKTFDVGDWSFPGGWLREWPPRDWMRDTCNRHVAEASMFDLVPFVQIFLFALELYLWFRLPAHGFNFNFCMWGGA
jgi:hypothetical protein